MFRRATAYIQTKEYRAAAEDLERVLQLEPNNKKVQEELNRLRRDHLETVGEQKRPKQGKRIEIEESDGEEDDSDGEKVPAAVATTEMQSEEMKDASGHPQGVPSASSVEEGKSVGSDEKSSIYSSNGPTSSPGTEGPITTPSVNPPQQDKETPPLATEQTTTPTQSAPAQQLGTLPPQVETRVPPQDDEPPQEPSASVTQQQENLVPEAGRATAVSQPQLVSQAPSVPEAQTQAALPAEVQVAPPPEPLPELPLSVKKLKDEGNDLFRRGQYGEAVSRYSQGVKLLEKGLQLYIVDLLRNIESTCSSRLHVLVCHFLLKNLGG